MMKRFLILMLALLLVLPQAALATDAPASAAAAEFQGYLVKLARPSERAGLYALEADGAQTGALYLAQDRAELRALAEQGLVEYYEPNYVLSAQDTYTPAQWGLAAVNAAAAWNHTGAGGTNDMQGDGVTVAVIDSGVYAGHSDLKSANILSVPAYPGVDGDHGTFVAGVIAAQLNNGNAADGVAPNVTLMPISIMKDNETTVAKAIDAIDYAADHGADVINLSLGGSNYSALLEAACRRAADKGIILVAAAGNYKAGVTKSEQNYMYPASYDCVVSVSACKQDGASAAFDSAYSYFNDRITVSAPGSGITSLSIGSPTDVKTASGTSFAAPMVSAMAAVAKQQNKKVNGETFTQLLRASARDLGEPGADVYYGSGLVDIGAFVDQLDKEYAVDYRSADAAAVFPQGTEPKRAYRISSETFSLPSPEQAGYQFIGWYETPDFSTPRVTQISSGSYGDRVLYARWESRSETAVTSVTAAGYPASWNDQNARYEGVVPKGTAMTAEEISVTPSAEGAAVSVPQLANGLWSFTVTSVSGQSSTRYTLAVTESQNSAPAVNSGAPSGAAAAPASLDGAAAATAYTADVSAWFTDVDGDALAFSLDNCDGAALAGHTLTFTPGARQAGTSVVLTLRAVDTNGFVSPALKLTVTVGSLPGSNATAKTASLAADLYALPERLALGLELYGNTVTAASLTPEHGTEQSLTAGTDYTVLEAAVSSEDAVALSKAFLSGLPVGRYTLKVFFSGGDPVDCALTVTDTAPLWFVSFDNEGAVQVAPDIRDGARAPLPTPPGKNGYRFTGWFTGKNGVGTPLLQTTEIHQNWYVYAAFEAEGGGTPGGGTPGGGTPDGGTTGGGTTGGGTTGSGTTGGGALPAQAKGKLLPAAGTDGFAYTLSEDGRLTLSPDEAQLAALDGSRPLALDCTGVAGALSVSVPEPLYAAAKSGLTIVLPGGRVELGAACLQSVRGELVFALSSAAAPDGAQSAFALTLTAAGQPLTRYALLRVPYTLPKRETAQEPTLMQDGAPLVFAYDATNAQLTARVRASGTLCVSLRERQGLFADVAQDAWYADAAATLSRAGLLQGVAPDTFDPRGSLTRGMLLTALWRLEGKPQAKPSGFADVSDGAWYADAVHWASEIGLVGGYGNGRVGALDPITREELMAILDRYCRYCGVVLPQTGESTLQAFHDVPELSPYAVEAAQHMVGLGVVHGDRGQLSPHAGAERAQAAVMLQRLLNILLVQE